MRSPLLAFLCAAHLAAAAGAVSTPQQTLARAFDTLYVSNLIRLAQVRVHNDAGEALHYTVQLASEHIRDRHHSYGIFTAPPRLRNLTILTIEADDRSDDHFLYLPSSGRVRRISAAQRNDSFMGTDLTYEDFERRRVDDYEVLGAVDSTVEGEPTLRITATPRFGSTVGRVEFEVAKADDVLLEVRSFKIGADRPFRVLHAPRSGMQQIGDKLLPSRLRIENFSRRTVTDVDFEHQAILPDLPDGLFKSANLELRRTIPGLPKQ